MGTNVSSGNDRWVWQCICECVTLIQCPPDGLSGASRIPLLRVFSPLEQSNLSNLLFWPPPSMMAAPLQCFNLTPCSHPSLLICPTHLIVISQSVSVLSIRFAAKSTPARLTQHRMRSASSSLTRVSQLARPDRPHMTRSDLGSGRGV